MEGAFGSRTRGGSRSIIALQPENHRKRRDAEERHDEGGVCEKIGAGDDGDAAEERDHGLLFVAVNRESRTDGSPDYGGNDGVGIPKQILG